MKPRVVNVSQQLKAMGNHLLRLAGDLSKKEESGTSPSVFAGFSGSKGLWLRAAEGARACREKRHDFFPSEFFGEPAWNILLDLFIVDLQGRHISVQDACLASGVPPTTALRYVGELERNDLLRRIADKTDGRRTFVQITTVGHNLMRQYLARTDPDLAAFQASQEIETALIKLDPDQNPT